MATAVLLTVFAGLWLHLTPYLGLNHDAQAYAAEGIASLHPDPLAGDLFLRFRSQEEFSMFPRIYGCLIDVLGLDTAAAMLTLLFQALWYGAAYLLARRLFGPSLAVFSTALLVTMPASYGGLMVFHLAEPFLTARLPAEGLGMLAAWAWLGQRRVVAVVLLALAMAIHPLMAFPVGLLLGLQWVHGQWGARAAWLAALAGVVLALVGSIALGGAEPTMQGRWLAVTALRSAFLFPLLWNVADWNSTLQCLLTVVIGIVVLRNAESSRMLQAALVLAVAGLALSLVYELVTPLKVLIQGQPWRWFWPARLLSMVALPAMLVALWRPGGMSRGAGIALAAAWLFVVPLTSQSDVVKMTSSLLCVLALVLQLAAGRVSAQVARLGLLFAWVLLAVVVCASVVTSSLAWYMAQQVELAGSGLGGRVANVLQVITPAVVIAVTAAWVCVRAWTPARGAACAVVGLFLVATAAPGAVRDWTAQPYSGRAVEQFAGWRQLVPADAEVLWWEQLRETWFLLQRRAYLTRSQSGGVVYSAEFADEYVRRALVLEPLIDREFWVGSHVRTDLEPFPLTVERMRQICLDPELGFVAWNVDLGTGAPLVNWPGPADRLYLYDCRHFRDGAADGH